MPLPAPLNQILGFNMFGQTAGIDPLAWVALNAVLAYTGYDDPSIVRDTSPTDLTPPKLRSMLTGTADGTALLATLEQNEGQLTRLCAFLRKLQSGDCDRFLINHQPNDIDHLGLLTNGAGPIHSFIKTWTPPADITTTAASKLILSDTASFRRLLTFIKSFMHDVSYLINALPQDNFSKIGYDKDDYLLRFLTIILTESKLDKTFKLAQGRKTGHALLAKISLHFLSNSDTLSEIQNLQSLFNQVSFTSVQNVIEEVQGHRNALEDLGQNTSDIDVYIKLKKIFDDAGPLLSNSCTAFRANNLIPNDGTLDLFVAFITSDPKAMAVRCNGSANNNRNPNVGANSLETDKVIRRKKKKDRHTANKKGFDAAMNALNVNSDPSNLPIRCIHYMKSLRIHWDDENIGKHSELNKIWNEHTNKDGVIDYGGFLARLKRDHADPNSNFSSRSSPQPPPPPAPRRNPNVSHANSLETVEIFEADIRRCETDDSIKTESSVQVNNVEADEFAAQVFSADSVDAEISAL